MDKHRECKNCQMKVIDKCKGMPVGVCPQWSKATCWSMSSYVKKCGRY